MPNPHTTASKDAIVEGKIERVPDNALHALRARAFEGVEP
jgi:hypothetical protein